VAPDADDFNLFKSFLLISGSLVGSSVVFQAGETALLPCDISVPPNSGANKSYKTFYNSNLLMDLLS
jgi:hypothetical protein